MITLHVTDEELKLLREGALALEMHFKSLLEGIAPFNGPNADEHRKRYSEKAQQAAQLYAKIAGTLI